MTVTRAHHRYWLARFTDVELARIASDLAGQYVPVARITHARAALTAASKQPE